MQGLEIDQLGKAGPSQIGASTNGSDGASKQCQLLDLPEDILSQIATCLTLEEAITFASLHPRLLSLTRTNLSPFPTLVHQALIAGPPYPSVLEVLPSLSLYQQPSDDGQMWLEALVRARPKWILERMTIGPRWRESLWKEAFHRRFLPSWRAYKKPGDTWRAVFLRTLGRLEHRYLGCSHEESWTRFLTLHRNGSGSLNRMYSRTFDPYQIYDELKGQNNLAAQPTTVRVLVHLQDIRIIVLGVLYAQPSLFVNPNAHILLHPPLLRGLSDGNNDRHHDTVNGSQLEAPTAGAAARTSNGTASSSSGPTEAYYPLVRTLSPSSPATTSYGLTDGPMPNLRQRLTSKLPSRPRRTSAPESSDQGHPAAEPSSSLARLGVALTHVRSREASDDTRPRKWSFGRTRSNSSAVLTTSQTVPNGPTVSENGAQDTARALPVLDELDTRYSADANGTGSPTARSQQRAAMRASQLPYAPLIHPSPTYANRLYPNWTTPPPPPQRPEFDAGLAAAEPEGERVQDFRRLHPDVADDDEAASWAGDAPWPDGHKRVEIGGNLEHARWVGPMLIMAQLHPCHRVVGHPPGAAPGPIEGDHPDLGSRGMFVSIGFEDLTALCPWLELKGGGAHHAEAMRDGLGY